MNVRLVPGRWWVATAVTAAACVLAAIPAIRSSALTALGSCIVHEDPLTKSDVMAVTFEAGLAGGLEAVDLYKQGMASAVVYVSSRPTPEEAELARRGFPRRHSVVDVMAQLGVPRASISVVDGGEGGTTEGTAALAAWAKAHRTSRVIVVVSPTHGRRYGRALRRVWPADCPPPLVRTTRTNDFRPDTWWQTRTPLRAGLVELQKLALDYVLHPL
jgi:hypothetical protein